MSFESLISLAAILAGPTDLDAFQFTNFIKNLPNKKRMSEKFKLPLRAKFHLFCRIDAQAELMQNVS